MVITVPYPLYSMQSHSSCYWCSRPSDFMFQRLEKFLSGHQLTTWPYNDAYHDLLNCSDCVKVFHDMISKYDKNHESVYKSIIQRVVSNLSNWFKGTKSCKTTCFVLVRELLTYPRLMLDNGANKLLVKSIKWFLSLNENHEELVTEKLPGLYLLLVHPIPQIRNWASTVVNSLGNLDWTSYENIEEIIDWMMVAITYNLFSDAPSNAGSAAWLKHETVRLPQHLAAYKPPSDFWFGVSALISVMDEVCIKRQLLGEDSKHRMFVDVIVNSFDNNSIFWPVLQIFATLLEKSRADFWSYIQTKHPQVVLNEILSQKLLLKSLQDWANSTTGSTQNSSNISRVRTIMFSWVKPFLSSVILFHNLCDVMSHLMSFVCTTLSQSLSDSPTFKVGVMSLSNISVPNISVTQLSNHLVEGTLANLSLTLVAELIELLFVEKAYKFLKDERRKWLPLLCLVCNFILFCRKNCSQVSSVAAVCKTVYTIFNNPIGQKSPSYIQIVCNFSSKLTSQSNETNVPLKVEVLRDEIITVLEQLILDKDVDGPYLEYVLFSNTSIEQLSEIAALEEMSYCTKDDIEMEHSDSDASVIVVKVEKSQRKDDDDSSEYDSLSCKEKLAQSIDRKVNTKELDLFEENGFFCSPPLFDDDDDDDDDNKSWHQQMDKKGTIEKLLSISKECSVSSCSPTPSPDSQMVSLLIDEGESDIFYSHSQECEDNAVAKLAKELDSHNIVSRKQSCDLNTIRMDWGSEFISTPKRPRLSLKLKRRINDEPVIPRKRQRTSSFSDEDDDDDEREIQDEKCNFSNCEATDGASVYNDMIPCTVKVKKLNEREIKDKIKGNVKYEIKIPLDVLKKKEYTGPVRNNLCDIQPSLIPGHNSLIPKPSNFIPESVNFSVSESVSELNGFHLEETNTHKADSSSEATIYLSTNDEIFGNSQIPIGSEYTVPESGGNSISLGEIRRSLPIGSEYTVPESGGNSISLSEIRRSLPIGSEYTVPESGGNSISLSEIKRSLPIGSEYTVPESGGNSISLSEIKRSLPIGSEYTVPESGGNSISLSEIRRSSPTETSDLLNNKNEESNLATDKEEIRDLPKEGSENKISEIIDKLISSPLTNKKKANIRLINTKTPPSSTTPSELFVKEAAATLDNAAVFDTTSPRNLVTEVLRWRPNKKQMPETTLKNKLISPLPLSYHSYKDYRDAMESVLLSRLWDEVYTSVRYNVLTHKATVDSVVHDTVDFTAINCQVTISRDEKLFKSLDKDYLVKVELLGDGNIRTSCFGCIQQLDRKKDLHNVNLKIIIARNDSLQQLRDLSVTFLFSFVPFLCKWNTLISINKSQLFPHLRLPKCDKHFVGKVHTTDIQCQENTLHHDGEIHFNKAQLSVIESAVSIIKEEYIIPRCLLVQGPPGTGKTSTVIGIIKATLKELKCMEHSPSALPNSLAQESDPHLLVCASSASGVEEIITRLKNYNLVNENRKTGSSDTYNILVIGSFKYRSDVQEYHLDYLINKKSRNFDKVNQVKTKILQLENRLKKLKRNPNNIGSPSIIETSIECTLREKKALETNLKSMTNQLHLYQHELDTYRKQLLKDADIIFCTLIESGNCVLKNHLKENPLYFNCIIIDEASNCSELETLIPLTFCNKLILLGDHIDYSTEQQRSNPTALTKKLELNRSLFSRLIKHFQSSENNPVHCLHIQYRMVPILCHFLSQQFYRGKLHIFESATNAKNDYKLCPFVFFNVTRGKESLCTNSEENKLLMNLVEVLLNNNVLPSSIGIITPFIKQKELIDNSLCKKFANNKRHKFKIGTVSDYQGYEKDIIILSCVATCYNGTGFLSSYKELVTALTRARRCVYIIGHCKSLKINNKDWSDLIQYCSDKGVLVNCSDTELYRSYVEEICNYRSDTGSGNSNHSNDTGGSNHSNDPGHCYSKCCTDLNKGQDVSVASKDSGIELQTVTTSDNSPDDVTSPLTTDSSDHMTSDNITSPDHHHVTSTSCNHMTPDHMTSDNEDYIPPPYALEHEPTCSWPDSQSVERPQLINYDELDYSKNFPPDTHWPVPTSNGLFNFGCKKRTAHADKKQIMLMRKLSISEYKPQLQNVMHLNH